MDEQIAKAAEAKKAAEEKVKEEASKAADKAKDYAAGDKVGQTSDAYNRAKEKYDETAKKYEEAKDQIKKYTRVVVHGSRPNYIGKRPQKSQQFNIEHNPIEFEKKHHDMDKHFLHMSRKMKNQYHSEH